MSSLFNAVSATISALFFAVTLFSAPLFAATPSMADNMPMSHNHGAMMAETTATDTNSYHSRGQIKTWNANSVSIAHGAIPALNWPPMTMTFDLPNNLVAAPSRSAPRSHSASARLNRAISSPPFQHNSRKTGAIMNHLNHQQGRPTAALRTGLARLLLAAAFSLPAISYAADITLEQALVSAERYSAELSANQHQVNALENMASSATQLPDPKLKFGIENLPVGATMAAALPARA